MDTHRGDMFKARDALVVVPRCTLFSLILIFFTRGSSVQTAIEPVLKLIDEIRTDLAKQLADGLKELAPSLRLQYSPLWEAPNEASKAARERLRAPFKTVALEGARRAAASLCVFRTRPKIHVARVPRPYHTQRARRAKSCWRPRARTPARRRLLRLQRRRQRPPTRAMTAATTTTTTPSRTSPPPRTRRGRRRRGRRRWT